MRKKKIRSIKDLDDFNKSIGKNPYFNNWNFKEIDNLVKSDIYNIYLLEIDNAVIGFLLLMTVMDSSEIVYIYINEQCRSSGLGFYLLNKSIEFLKEKKVKKLFLEVADNNIPARKLYEKLGFKQIGIRKKYYKNQIDALTLKLNL